jgi:hypothetical protein
MTEEGLDKMDVRIENPKQINFPRFSDELSGIASGMLVIQIAMAKMIIAFRDDKWPEQ